MDLVVDTCSADLRRACFFFGERMKGLRRQGVPIDDVIDEVRELVEGGVHAARQREAADADLAPLLEAGLNSIKRRSLVFVVSDFISVPGWERPLNWLNRRHEVLDSRETNPVLGLRAIRLCLERPEIFIETLTDPAILYITRTHVDVVFTLEQIRLELRLAGLDHNPGWVPELGHVITFHFE